MLQLHVRHLSKSFHSSPLFSNLTFSIEAGERFVLLGKSGSGKSTLLRCIAGLESADSGDVVLGDTPISPLPPEKRDVVYLFQESILFPFYSVEENVGFGLKMKGVSPEVIRQKSLLALEQVGLKGYGNRKPASLSGGEAQRVSLARALVLEPKVLLLDEPLSSLDASLRDEMRRLICTLQESTQTTMMIVTHDQMEAAVMAHRIGILIDGALQQIGTPKEIFKSPANEAVAAFISASLLEEFQKKMSQ